MVSAAKKGKRRPVHTEQKDGKAGQYDKVTIKW